MKKVLGTISAAILLATALPMTASTGHVKPGCGGIFFRPCPMPPGATGTNPNGTRSGGSSSTGNGSNSSSTGRGTTTHPPSTMPPVGGR